MLVSSWQLCIFAVGEAASYESIKFTTYCFLELRETTLECKVDRKNNTIYKKKRTKMLLYTFISCLFLLYGVIFCCLWSCTLCVNEFTNLLLEYFPQTRVFILILPKIHQSGSIYILDFLLFTFMIMFNRQQVS